MSELICMQEIRENEEFEILSYTTFKILTFFKLNYPIIFCYII